MPGRSEPPRNLGDMLGAQTRRNTPRRSSEFLKNIDAVLSEVDDSQAVREAKKAKNTAEIEKIFPGVEEDEKTLSGMYEPALHHYPSDRYVTYPVRGDSSYSFGTDRMYPPSTQHQAFGTSPNQSVRYQTIDIPYENDIETPDFGTEREQRDYLDFELARPSKYPIDSPEYWHDMDTRSHNPQIRDAANAALNRIQNKRMTIDANRAAAAILGTSRRSRNSEEGPIRPWREAAQLMSMGEPTRTPKRKGRSSFVGKAEPVSQTGRLPQELSPNLRNLETDYTVYSYETPIAWRTTQGHWEVPRIKYSPTTLRHQNALRRALSNSYHSPLQEASYRLYDLQQRHREQGIRLPSKNYEINVGFETFHNEPPSENTINSIVEDHVQRVINPAIAERRRGTRVQRRQSQRNQPQLPLEGGNE